MRLSLWSWLAIVGFQIVFGATVFVVSGHFYYYDPAGAVQFAQVSRDVPRNGPHTIPGRIVGKDSPLLVGGERFPVADAQRLTMAAMKDKASETQSDGRFPR